jgi:SAM-dependent methyltransferase
MKKTLMKGASVAEDFKPIPIRVDDGRWGSFKAQARCLIDLQLLTCLRFLRPVLAQMHGSVLDVGCGEMPFRGLLPADVRYTGIDVAQASEFGMRDRPDVIAFDGAHIPFADASFDNVICTEVLEHTDDPEELIGEMYRVLRPGGVLAATVPFSAREHHIPYDFHRYTRYRLAQLFDGFSDVRIVERGDDLAVVANKLVVICMRLVRPSVGSWWRWPVLLVVAAPATVVALGIAHASIRLGWGSKADPLGFGIVAHKS